MKLSNLLDESVVKIGLEGEDKEEVLAEMIDMLARAGRVQDREHALQAILAREELATTGIGDGLAVPHGKHASVKKLTVALGISKKGVEFDATDGEPVYVIFLVLAEANNPGPHVQCLGEVARLLQVPGLAERLRNAKSAREAIDAIRAEE